MPSMNEINAVQRMRVAATEKGEADPILKVTHAQGEAESKALQSRGIADQRQAIIAGLRDSVDEFRRSMPGTRAKDVMNLAASTRTNVIPHEDAFHRQRESVVASLTHEAQRQRQYSLRCPLTSIFDLFSQLRPWGSEAWATT